MIFIGGIHGVGKTSLCKILSERYKVPHFSASHLISAEKKEAYSRNKFIPDINRNQDLLSSSLNRLGITGEFLLDGHFCLFNQDSQITRIPLDTFNSISPKSIIVFTDLIRNIQERLCTRDSNQLDIHLLQSFQDEEVKYAEEVSYELRIPMLVAKVEDTSAIYKFFDDQLS